MNSASHYQDFATYAAPGQAKASVRIIDLTFSTGVAFMGNAYRNLGVSGAETVIDVRHQVFYTARQNRSSTSVASRFTATTSGDSRQSSPRTEVTIKDGYNADELRAVLQQIAGAE